MGDAPTAYPLRWPQGWPRTEASRRKPGSFSRMEALPGMSWKTARDVTVAEAIKRVLDELRRLGGTLPVISTNLKGGRGGMPLSDQAKPRDPGACLYFQYQGRATALPCDRYTTVAHNLAAIAAHLEATRAIERHGVGSVAQMFAGFQALRGPGPKPWRETFGLKPDEPVTEAMIRERHRNKARELHPDVANVIGADAAMAELNAARDAALEELRDE